MNFVLIDLAPSLASQLPQVICVGHKFCIHCKSLWELACQR